MNTSSIRSALGAGLAIALSVLFGASSLAHAQTEQAAPHPGAAPYARACAQCHEGGVAKAPHKTFLQMMPADGLLLAMEQGIMQAQSAGLDAAERRAVAEYLAGVSLDTLVARAAAPMCMGPARDFDLRRPPAKAGWGVSRENQRHIPAEVAQLAASDLPKLKLKWAFAFPNAQRARSQPTVAMGAVFVGSQNGTVYALDKESGCVRWTFRASAEVRSPVTLEGWDAGSPPQRPPRLLRRPDRARLCRRCADRRTRLVGEGR